MVEVGPTAIRQLCCNTIANDDAMVGAALDSIDDPVTLVDFRPVSVDALWRMVLGSHACRSAERAIVVHPSWWSPTRIDVISAAAQVLAADVVLRPRSWLLRQACAPESQRATMVVEIADCFVVISGATVVAKPPRGEPKRVAEAVVRSILDITSGMTAVVIIDAPSPVTGARALATMIAERLRAHDEISAVQIDDARMKKLAAVVLHCEDSSPESQPPTSAGRGPRRHRVPVLLVALLVATMLGVFALLAAGRHAAPVGDTVATTFLVEGNVAVEVPSQWPMRRVVDGPGSARVQLTSPSDPEVALHVTQSRLAVATLSATAESLKHAIDSEPTGTFVDFNPVDTSAGRPAVTYREIRPGHDVRWIVLVDKTIRISIGCQSRHGDQEAVRQICELAVQSARAVS